MENLKEVDKNDNKLIDALYHFFPNSINDENLKHFIYFYKAIEQHQDYNLNFALNIKKYLKNNLTDNYVIIYTGFFNDLNVALFNNMLIDFHFDKETYVINNLKTIKLELNLSYFFHVFDRYDDINYYLVCK